MWEQCHFEEPEEWLKHSRFREIKCLSGAHLQSADHGSEGCGDVGRFHNLDITTWSNTRYKATVSSTSFLISCQLLSYSWLHLHKSIMQFEWVRPRWSHMRLESGASSQSSKSCLQHFFYQKWQSLTLW